MCAGVTHTFIAGENRDKQREEEQREEEQREERSWRPDITRVISSRRGVSDRGVRRIEKTNVIKERTKMNETGEGEQKEDERLGLVPVTLCVSERDQNSTAFKQYGAQFIIGILLIDRNCEREFKPIIFVVVSYFDRSTFFPELPTNSFCSGAPQRGAHHWSEFATYCRVQYLFFTHMSHGKLKSRAIINRPTGTWNFNFS